MISIIYLNLKQTIMFIIGHKFFKIIKVKKEYTQVV